MIASVQFFHFWPVEIFQNLRSVLKFFTNAFLVTSKKCRWSAVILIVFVSLRFSLYQCTFLNTDDSISYFAKHIVLELSKKCRWSAVILTILKFNERVPYHERVQVSDFVIFGKLDFLKICAAFLNFAQTRFL